MDIKNNPVNFLEINRNEDSFRCVIHYHCELYTFTRNFYKILVILADRYVVFHQKNANRNFEYKLYTQSQNEDYQSLEIGRITDMVGLEKAFENIYLSLKIFVLDKLRSMPQAEALEQSYHLQYELKESYRHLEPQIFDTIFYPVIQQWNSGFVYLIDYFEKLLQLEKYKQFVHLKDNEVDEQVHLTGLTPSEIDEIVEVFSELSIFGNEESNKLTLRKFFLGKPDVVEYIVLKGLQKEIAYIFISLFKDHRFSTTKKRQLADWVKRRFRVINNDKISLFGDEAFRSKSQETVFKRINLSFLDYDKLK